MFALWIVITFRTSSDSQGNLVDFDEQSGNRWLFSLPTYLVTLTHPSSSDDLWICYINSIIIVMAATMRLSREFSVTEFRDAVDSHHTV